MGDTQFGDMFRRRTIDAFALKANFAGAWPLQARDCAQGRCFSGAIGADQGGDLTLFNTERDTANSGNLLVVDA